MEYYKRISLITLSDGAILVVSIKKKNPLNNVSGIFRL